MEKGQKIVVVGADWYGGWAKDFYLALRELGMDAELIYTNSVPFAAGNSDSSALLLERVKKVVRWMGGFFFKTAKHIRTYLAERELLKKLSKFNFEKESVTVISIWTPLSPSVLQSLKNRGIRLVMWQGEPASRNPEWAKALGYYDHIFIVDDEWASDFESQELKKKLHLLPLATNPHIHKPISSPQNISEEYRADVAFVGLYRPERARIISVLKDLGLKVYGPGWEAGFIEFPWLKDKYFGILSNEEVMTVFNNAKISIGALGISFNPGPTTTQRTFDISASRKFQLSQYNHLTPKFFGNAVVTFRSTEELREKAEYYLAHPEERDRLSAEAYEITLRDHTYVNRARTLLAECNIPLPQ